MAHVLARDRPVWPDACGSDSCASMQSFHPGQTLVTFPIARTRGRLYPSGRLHLSSQP